MRKKERDAEAPQPLFLFHWFFGAKIWHLPTGTNWISTGGNVSSPEFTGRFPLKFNQLPSNHQDTPDLRIFSLKTPCETNHVGGYIRNRPERILDLSFSNGELYAPDPS